MGFDDIPLTPQQSDIVACLLENRGRPMRCSQIAAAIGSRAPNSIKVQVAGIRAAFKAGDFAAQIESVAGGYVLQEVQP